MVFVGLTAVALLFQGIAMLVGALMFRKTIANVQNDVNEIRSTVMPMLVKSKELLEKVAPKVESVAADVADMAQAAKEQTAHLRATTDEILNRVERQTSRVDSMFTTVVDGVEHATIAVTDSVVRPVRQINAMLASAKAFLSVLATGRRPERPVEVVTDQDMFV